MPGLVAQSPCPPREWFGTAAGERFGAAIVPLGDIDGDGAGDFAVGSPFGRDTAGLSTGVVRAISSRTGTLIWSISGTLAFSQFGQALATIADLNADGVPELAIGAWNHANGGRVALHSGRTGTRIWVRDGLPAERYGWAVADAGDQNGDGKNDILIGAPGFDGDRGRALILDSQTSAPLSIFTGSSPGEQFGTALARLGDFQASPEPELAIAAPLAATPLGARTGRVEVRRGGDGILLWLAEGDAAQQRFGAALAVQSDRDGDLVPELVVGAPLDGRLAAEAGLVVVLSGASGQVLQRVPSPHAGERFGSCIQSVGNRRGTATEDLAVGAPGFNPGNARDTGRVAILRAIDAAAVQSIVGTQAGGFFGESISPGGRINDDTRDDFLIGSPEWFDAAAGPRAGTVAIFHAPNWRNVGVAANGNPMRVRFNGPPRFGEDLGVEVEGAAPGAPVWIGFSGQENRTLLQQGSLTTELRLPLDSRATALLGPLQSDQAGIATTTIRVSNAPFVDGCPLLAQAISFDAQGRTIASILTAFNLGY